VTRRRTSLRLRCAHTAGTLFVALPLLGLALDGIGRLLIAGLGAVGVR
jgi:hypothetical protein